MTDTDNCSTTRKVCFAENCSNVTVGNDVLNGMKDLPQALTSWIHCLGEILPMLTCFLLIIEQEAPESNSECI